MDSLLASHRHTALASSDARAHSRTLDTLPLRANALVCGLVAAAGIAPDHLRQLSDIGFVAGEPVAVLARGWPSGEPLVVQIGASRFALRRAEAACVETMAVPATGTDACRP